MPEGRFVPDGAAQTAPSSDTGDAGRFVPDTANAAASPEVSGPSAGKRFTGSYKSGVGIVSPEEGKSFFQHPIDTAKGIIKAQGDVGNLAYKELGEGKYGQGLSDLAYSAIPGYGPVLSKGGHQLSSGDIAGGIGTTLGAATTLLADPQIRAGAIEPIKAGAAAVKETAGKVASPVIRATARTAQGAGDVVGELPFGVGKTIKAVTKGAQLIKQLSTPTKDIVPWKLKVPGQDFGLPSAEEEIATPAKTGWKGAAPIEPTATPATSGWKGAAPIEPTTVKPTASPVENTLEEPKLSAKDQRAQVHRIGEDAANDLSPEGREKAMRLVKGTNENYADLANTQGPEKQGGAQWEAKDFSTAKTASRNLHPNKQLVIDHARNNVPHDEFMKATENWGPPPAKFSPLVQKLVKALNVSPKGIASLQRSGLSDVQLQQSLAKLTKAQIANLQEE